MHPPRFICEELYRLHPQLRMAWRGREKKYEGELNPGSFAIIQLYHIKDAGKQGEAATFMAHWNEPGKYLGPIFDRHGGCSRDWDPLFRIPIYVADLEDFKIPIEDVFSGKLLLQVKEWLVPIGRRIRESHREATNALVRETEDIADEASDYLWRQAQRSDAETVIKANKHCREEMEAWEKQKEQADKLKHYYDMEGL